MTEFESELSQALRDLMALYLGKNKAPSPTRNWHDYRTYTNALKALARATRVVDGSPYYRLSIRHLAGWDVSGGGNDRAELEAFASRCFPGKEFKIEVA